MTDGFFEFHPRRKHHEFDLRPPAQRSRMRKRIEEAVTRDIAEMLYETDTACRERLGRRCKRLMASREFPFLCCMLQDGVRIMNAVRYLRRCDPQSFGMGVMTEDALRMMVMRMAKAVFTQSVYNKIS